MAAISGHLSESGNLIGYPSSILILVLIAINFTHRSVGYSSCTRSVTRRCWWYDLKQDAWTKIEPCKRHCFHYHRLVSPITLWMYHLQYFPRRYSYCLEVFFIQCIEVQYWPIFGPTLYHQYWPIFGPTLYHPHQPPYYLEFCVNTDLWVGFVLFRPGIWFKDHGSFTLPSLQ